MATCLPFDDEEPFDVRVKSLADDELLEIWEETQQLATLLGSDMYARDAIGPDYERVIVEELRLRSCRKLSSVAL